MNDVTNYLESIFEKFLNSDVLNPLNFYDALLREDVAGGVLFYQYILFIFALYLLSYLTYKFILRDKFSPSLYTERHQEIIRMKSFKIDMWWNILSILKIRNVIIKIISIMFLTEFFLNNDTIKQFSESNLLKLLNSCGGNYISCESLFIIKLFFLFLVADLGIYIAHRLSHSVNFLWCFHKVHHYPTQITYFANNRQHPFEAIFWGSTQSIMIAIYTVLFMPLYQDLGNIHFDNVFLTFFVLTFPKFMNHFVHIHIPISYGKILNKIFVSPVVHAIHHSDLIYNKNFGSMFSIWDVIFKTYYLPKTQLELLEHYKSIGAGVNDEYYKNIIDAMIKPFKEAYGVLVKKHSNS